MLAIALALAVAATCPIENAHYHLRHMETVTLTFTPVSASRDWPSAVALAVHFKSSGHTNYFLPWNGGSDDLQNVARTTDVTASDFKLPSPDGGPGRLGDMVYIATDANYNILDMIPQKGRAAPAHIFISGLSDNDWKEDATVKQFFDFGSCVTPKN